MTTDSKDPVLVEEGVILTSTPSNIDDNKSDAGSATTTPSVESGDSSGVVMTPPKTNHKRRWMFGGAALLVLGGVIAAVVVSTCDKSSTKKKSSQAGISFGGDDQAPPMFDFEPPFERVDLPLFDKDALETYESREDLEKDLTIAAQQAVNKVLQQNLQYELEYHYNTDTEDDDWTVNVNLNDIAVEAAIPLASASAKQATATKIKKATTNNQEADADEADYIKTDGQHVYAAYGDYLVVWDLQGEMVAQVQMPTPQTPAGENEFDDDFMMRGDPFLNGMGHAWIESIHVTEKHVLVVVGGLGEYSNDDVAFGSKATQLRVYNKASLDLVASRDIHGYYFASKWLESTDSIHIVTGGDFNTWDSLIGPLDMWNFPSISTAEEYLHAAAKIAEEELIPNFVKKMADFFIQGNNGQMPSLMKVNSWMTERIATTPQDKMSPQEHYYGQYDDAFRSYVQVTSLPVGTIPTTVSTEETTLEMSTTALMGPSTWGFMYATEESLVLHMSRYHWDEETNHSEETLFLLHLKVDVDSTVTFHSQTSLPGRLPAPKAIDIQGNDLRVATTLQKWMPMDNVWPVCGDAWYFEDSCMNENNWNDCFDVAIGCRNVLKTGCPYTFECADDESDEVLSSTDNFVHVFDISQAGEMTEHGRVRIGDPHEVILGVHFGETFSYANTFDQRDPFYVLKLEAGKAPVVSGELKLEGFSSYLQPISEDGSLVVGIGQNVTGAGTMEQTNTGLLVTVFDVSDPADPKALASQMLADPKEYDSYSEAEADHRAVQYGDGYLVIPLTMYKKYSYEEVEETTWTDDENGWLEDTPEFLMSETGGSNFEGFVVLDVGNAATQGIKEVARIDHSHKQTSNCRHCNGNVMYRRSLMFEDQSLMTVHNAGVKSTDLTSGNPLWSFEIRIDGEDMSQCCGY